ncbi:MAG: hypothetical protein GY940_00415, partial [bacterium]|nr:hypothetical protein [bacterium]
MKPDKAKKANLSINGGSKAWAGRVLVLMITVLLLAFNLNLEAKPHSRKDKDKKKGNPFHRVEITGVDHTECVSPNEDGKKDRMELNAYFDGKPRHKVYAFLFIKKNRRIVRFLAGQSRFSSEGKAAIRLEWDGKDWRKRPVANGFYRLHLYYFNFPSLFNSKGAKHHKAYNKLIKAILKHKKKGHRAVKEWMGEVSVDTEAPLITVNAPADGLETTVQQTETAGIASGGDKLTINNNPVSLSGTTFTTTLPLAMGPNVFTYVLEDCAGNRAVKSVTVTRIEEPLPPEAAFNADPLSIQSGSSSTLTWTSLNAGTVTIDNNIGAVALNGSITVTPNQTTTYTIIAEGPGGSVSASVTVEVTFPAPTVTLTASPSSITSGDSSTLSWTSTGAGSVSIDNGIGSVDLNGSITVTPNETVTYTITAEGPGGTATAEATVEVTNPAPEVTLTVSPESVEEGNPVTLSWSSINADSVSIDNGIGPVDLNGSLTVSPVATTTYTVTAEGPGGTETAEATVEVTINPEHFTAVYGRVFDAESGSPLADAVVSASGKTVQSDGDGYWQLAFGSGGLIKIVISKEGYTNAYRKIRLGTGSEGTVTNAYLTLHDTTTTPIGPEGGTHGNSDGSVEVIVPAGALDIVKEIRATRLSSSKALPGDMNATDNLEFPIGFLFCADFGPDETHFNVPVTIRVQNSWGFEPGTEIPYAYWNKDTHKWVPENAMAKVDHAGEWLEAKVTHFRAWDINSALSFGGGPPV